MKLNWSLAAIAVTQLASSVVVQLVVIASLGIGGHTDAFMAAQTVTVVILAVLSNALQNVWQPKLSILDSQPSKWKAALRAQQGQVFLIFTGVAFIVQMTSAAWIPLLFPGFEPVERALTETLLLPLLGAMLFGGHFALLTTAQRSRDRFIGVEVALLVVSLASIGVVALLVPRYGVKAAAWTTFARSAVMYLVAFRMTDCPRPSLMAGWKCYEVWRQLRPLIVATSIYKSGPLVDRFWTSQAPVGAVSIFALAQSAVGGYATVLDRAICVPSAPLLARLADSGDYAGIKRHYRRCIGKVAAAAALLPIILILLYPVWQSLLLMALKIGPTPAQSLWIMCMMLSGYLFVGASGSIVVSAFFAIGDDRTPAIVGVGGFFIGLAIKSAGFICFGVVGLAVGTSMYYLINLATMCILLERRIDVRST